MILISVLPGVCSKQHYLLTEYADREGDNGEGDTAERFDLIRNTNRQHPDHPTSTWPVSSLDGITD